jgi:DNA polymerase III delta prime subunit
MKTLFMSMHIYAALALPFYAYGVERLSYDLAKRDPQTFFTQLQGLETRDPRDLQKLKKLFEEISGGYAADLMNPSTKSDPNVNLHTLAELLHTKISRSVGAGKESNEFQAREKRLNELVKHQLALERPKGARVPLRRAKSASSVIPKSLPPTTKPITDPFLASRCDVPGKKYEDWYAGNPDKNVQAFLVTIAVAKKKGGTTPTTLNNLLLYGPKGTGKTTLANALIAVSGYPSFCISNTMIQRSLVGESAQLLSGIFESAYQYAVKHHTRVILFTDEVDALFTKRAERSSVADHNQQVSSTFQAYFSESGGKHPDFLSRVMYIATTNYRDAIPDPILSRFVHQSEMKDISVEQREKVIRHMLQKKQHDSLLELTQSDYRELAEKSAQFQLDLRQIEAAISRVIYGSTCVKMKDECRGDSAIEDILALIDLPTNSSSQLTKSVFLKEFEQSQGEKPESEEWKKAYN